MSTRIRTKEHDLVRYRENSTLGTRKFVRYREKSVIEKSVIGRFFSKEILLGDHGDQKKVLYMERSVIRKVRYREV